MAPSKHPSALARALTFLDVSCCSLSMCHAVHCRGCLRTPNRTARRLSWRGGAAQEHPLPLPAVIRLRTLLSQLAILIVRTVPASIWGEDVGCVQTSCPGLLLCCHCCFAVLLCCSAVHAVFCFLPTSVHLQPHAALFIDSSLLHTRPQTPCPKLPPSTEHRAQHPAATSRFFSSFSALNLLPGTVRSVCW